MKFRAKKLIAFLMAFLMVAQMAPVTVFAADQMDGFHHTVTIHFDDGVTFPDMGDKSLYVALLQKQTASVPTDSNLSWMNGQEYWFYDIKEVTSNTNEISFTELKHFDQNHSQAYAPAGSGIETRVFFGICDGQKYNFEGGITGNNFTDCSTIFNGYSVAMTTSGNATSITVSNTEASGESSGPLYSDDNANVFVHFGYSGTEAPSFDTTDLYIVAGNAGSYFHAAEYKGFGDYQFNVSDPASAYVILKYAKGMDPTGGGTDDIVVWNSGNITTQERLGGKELDLARNSNDYTITVKADSVSAGDNKVSVRVTYTGDGNPDLNEDNYYIVVGNPGDFHALKYHGCDTYEFTIEDTSDPYVILKIAEDTTSAAQGGTSDIIVWKNGSSTGDKLMEDAYSVDISRNASDYTLSIDPINLKYVYKVAVTFPEDSTSLHLPDNTYIRAQATKGAESCSFEQQISRNDASILEYTVYSDWNDTNLWNPSGNNFDKTFDTTVNLAIGDSVVAVGSEIGDFKVSSITLGAESFDSDNGTKTVTDTISLIPKDMVVSADYNFRTILGNGVYYGITATRLKQSNHLQTNFAVKKFYHNCDSEAQPNLSGSSTGLFYIGEIENNVKLDSNGSSGSAQIVVYTPDTDKVQKSGGRTEIIHAVYESQSNINSLVGGIQSRAATISEKMAQHQVTIEPQYDSNSKVYIDTRMYPSDATIYIDADKIYNAINTGGRLNIQKHDNQVIVFTFDETSNPLIKEFYCNGRLSTSSQTAGANAEAEKIAKGIVWNYRGSGTVTLDTICGMVLAPNGNVKIAGSSAGWIICGGEVENTNGEWHHVFDDQPAVDYATLIAHKTVENVNAKPNQKFKFRVEKYQTSDPHWVKIGDDKENDGGTVEFTGLACTPGWNVFKIIEDKAAAEQSGYNNDETKYYAAVFYKQVGNSYVASQARYFKSFTERNFNASGDSVEAIGLSNEITDGAPVFNNTKKTEEKGQLTISKILIGAENQADRDTKFQFTITISGLAENKLPNGNFDTDKPEKVKFVKGVATIELKGGESRTIKGLPLGVTYTVTEASATGFKLTGIVGAVGTISTTPSTATFTNTKKNGLGEIKVKKNLVGRAWTTNDAFTFTLTPVNGAPMPKNDDGSDITSITIKKNDTNYTKSFGVIKFTAEGTYQYEVTETHHGETIKGVKYDDTVKKTITIIVKDNGGDSLVADPSSSLIQTTEFTNTYAAEGKGEIKVKKNLEGRDWIDGDTFTFTLSADTGTPMPANTSITIMAADGETTGEGEDAVTEYIKSFGEIKYTQPGTYTYTVKETKGTKGGITYDTADHTIVIKVKDQGDGTLVADTGSALVQTQEITNTYDASGKIRFAGTKIIEGRYFTDLDTMVVCITDNDSKESIEQEILSFTPGETAQQFVMDATFDYSLEDIGGAGKRKTFTYTAEEKEVSMFGTTPRSEKHEVEVTVADNYTGTLIIEEVTVDGVKVEYDDAIEAFGGIEFINTYHTEDEVQIKAEKELKGMTLKPGAFTFTLTAEDDVVALIGDSAKQTKTNDADGNVEFDSLKFAVYPTEEEVAAGYVDIADLPMVNGHYEFTLTLAESETGLADRDIRIQGAKQYTITVNVDYNPNNGKLDVSIKPDDQEFKFTNLKNAKADIDVGAQKKMLGRDLKDGEFNFTLKGQVTDEYSVDQAKTNDGTGAITFDKLYFAVYPTDAQTTAGYIDVTDKVVDSGEYEIKLKVSEDLAALASKPEVIPVSPLLPDGSMSYDVTVTLKYDKETGTLTAEIDKKMADMVFINRVVKVSKVDIVDEHELPGSLIQIYASSVVAPNGRGEKVCEFVSGKEPTEVTGLHPGKEYILHEELAPNGYLLAADTTFIIDKEDGTITSDALRTSDGVLLIKDDMIKVSATVRKIWDDDDNRDGIRPASIEVVLLRKTEGVDPDDTIPYRKVTLSEANNWIATEKDLPMVDSECRNYIYTWQEPAAGTGYTLTSSKMDNGTLTTLTNTHVPEKIPISVKKIWVDNDNALKLRPTSIDVQLYADGQAVGKPITLDKNNDWEYTWKDQDKNVHENGLTREIVYTVAETTVPEGYICTISGSTGKGFVVKNTLDTGKLVIEKEFDITPWEPDGPDDSPIDIPVIKTWNDNGNKDGNRPASVTVRLLANGTEVANAELNAGNNWRYTFTGMPRIDESKEKINYTITEDPVEWYKAEINGFNIRNNYEPELTSVAVTKVWDDNNNVQNQRPASIVMTLSNGMSVELNDQNNWTAQIDNLPTRVNGQPVTYTWTEQRVIGYTKVREVTEGNMTTFTNRIWERPKENNGGKKPKTVGDTVITFEEYETPLGVEIVINHVGDCFD